MLIAFSIVAVLCLIYVFLIFPSGRKHSDLKLLKNKYIAHRGLHSIKPDIPENTMAAFRSAADSGYIIENDIHLTRDGEVVVFHDDNLNRMCGVDKKIAELTLAEIKECRIKGAEMQIPTLSEALKVINGKVPLLIEFKANAKNYKRLCEAANKVLKEYNGKYFVQSFHPFVLGWYKKHRPDILRGQLASAFCGEELYKQLAGNLLFNFISRPDFVSYDHLYKNKLSRRLCTLFGAYPVGWTFKSQAEIDASRHDFCTYIFETFIPRT